MKINSENELKPYVVRDTKISYTDNVENISSTRFSTSDSITRGYYSLVYNLSKNMFSLYSVLRKMYSEHYTTSNLTQVDGSIRCLTYNLVRAVKLRQSQISFSSDRNRYNNVMINGRKVPTGAGYTGTMKLVNMLEEQGLLVCEKGYNVVTPFGNRMKSGYLVLTQQLINLVESNVDLEKVRIGARNDVLFLRDDKGNDLEFLSSKYTKEIISVLNKYNKMMAKCDVRIANIQLDTGLARIFNSDFDHGGRLYTSGNSYQGMPAFMRNKITINGYPTAEVDIKGSHISILHTLCDSRLLEGYDPYEISMEGVADFDIDKMSFMLCEYDAKHNPFRNLVKVALLIMVNASGYPLAKGALENKIEDQLSKDLDKVCNMSDVDLSTMTLYGLKNINVQLLFKRLKEKHKVIKEHFFSGAGVWLQKMEGDIFTKVIERCIEKDYPVLIIHDSCRADIRHIKEIGEFITTAWYDVVGDISNLKLEYEF